MRVLIQTEALPSQFRWDPLNPRRGTEQFYVETAKWLVRFGHTVWVQYDGVDLTVDGVRYIPREDSVADLDCLLLANWRSARGLCAKRVVYWTAFADFRLDQISFNYCDAAVVISNYAFDLAGDGNADSPDLFAVPLGLDKAFWCRSVDDKENTCIYTSSPDRGGSWLKSVWREIRGETGFDLICSPYPGSGEEPWSPQRLRAELREAKYWLHPGKGRELFCLSGAEAQACDTVPVIVPHEALAETVRWGHRFPSDQYLDGLVSVLKSKYVRGVNADHILSWEQATRKLEVVLKP